MENMTKTPNAPTPLSKIIADIFQDAGLPFNPGDAEIWRVWDEVVGSAVAQNAGPSWIKDGRLRVKVSNSVWLQELAFQQEIIREKLNRRLGRKAVNKIEFRLSRE